MLVTGSNAGIGLAVVQQAAAAGFVVYGGARRESTFDTVRAAGGCPLLLDVTDPQQIDAAVSRIEREHGAVEVLVNNAGYGQLGPVETVSREQWLRQYDTNVFGLVQVAQRVLPAMRARRRGRILNVSSMGGEFTFPLAAAYHSTKYAVESISDALRFEARPFGIQVISIQPGVVRTALLQTTLDTLQLPAGSPYQPLAATMERLSGSSAGSISAERVARTIVYAARTARPRTRYKIGMMAHMLPWLRHTLPDRAWDALLRRLYA
jgi:NAD(P)-dependent dehydrogenase (short-subunit alcohol dehydrogenase family)